MFISWKWGIRTFLQNWKIFIGFGERMSRSWGTIGILGKFRCWKTEFKNSILFNFYWLQMVRINLKWARSFILWICRDLLEHFFEILFFHQFKVVLKAQFWQKNDFFEKNGFSPQKKQKKQNLINYTHNYSVAP